MVQRILMIVDGTFAAEAAALMFEKRIGALPVVQDGALVGIITETDVLGVLTEMMGASKTASRLEIEVPASPGVLTDVIRILEGQQAEIASLVTLPAGEGARRLLIMRLRTINPDPVVSALAERGYPQVVSEFVS